MTPMSLALASGQSRRRARINVVRQVAAVADGSTKVAQSTVDAVRSIFSDVLDAKAPHQLDVFLSVLESSGWDILGKDEWKTLDGDLHPFILPLGKRGAGEDLEVVGLLVREPNGKKFRQTGEMMVVSQQLVKGPYVKLLAMEINKYIAKQAEEAVFNNEKKDLGIIEAAKDVYDISFKGADRRALEKWLLLEVGPFPDVHQSLLEFQLEQDDEKSALIVADTMRSVYGDAWCFPHQTVSHQLRTHFNGQNGTEDRTKEAERCAQQCFTSGYPLWTLSADLLAKEPLKDLLVAASMPKVPDMDTLRVFYLKRVTDDQRKAVRTGNISLGIAALARAQALMDGVVCGHKTFNTVRDELSDIYEEVPGYEDLVDFILYFKQPKKD